MAATKPRSRGERLQPTQSRSGDRTIFSTKQVIRWRGIGWDSSNQQGGGMKGQRQLPSLHQSAKITPLSPLKTELCVRGLMQRCCLRGLTASGSRVGCDVPVGASEGIGLPKRSKSSRRDSILRSMGEWAAFARWLPLIATGSDRKQGLYLECG